MNLTQSLKTAGLLVYTDEARQYHLRYLPECCRRARRFAKLQSTVAKKCHKTPGIFAARLVLLDLVQPIFLNNALKSTPFLHLGRVYLNWEVIDVNTPKEKSRIDRRCLSNSTLLSIASRQSDVQLEVVHLTSLLRGTGLFAGVDEKQLLEELEKDLCCWAARNLPGPFWSHLMGLQTMWAASRETFGRLSSTRVIAPVDLGSGSIEIAVAEFTDAAFTASTVATTDQQPNVLNHALAFITFSKEEAATATLDRWLKDLLTLKTSIQYGDFVTALIVSWMVDLVESGTDKKPDAAIETRARYIKQTALRLWNALTLLKGVAGKWAREQLLSAYTGMLADPTCSDKRGLGAGISSFQLYASEIWGLPLVKLTVQDFVPDPIPRVQIVHAHEVRLALHWLDSCADGDGRLLSICSVMLSLLYDAPFRVDELHWARLGNIKFNHDFTLAEIEIYRLPSNPLKTESSTRRLTVTDVEAIQRLRDWIEKRRQEGAGDDDLVFGQKLGATLYRRTLVHATLRRVLKAATGDPDMTIHALRHSFASREFTNISGTNTVVDQNRLTHLAEQMGHESCNMTLRFYVHSFEDALRHAIDRRTQISIVYTSTDTENLTSTTAFAVRKQSSIRGTSVSQLTQAAIDRKAESCKVALELDTSGWVAPKPPSMRVGDKENFSAIKVWEILQSLESTASPDLSALAHTHDVLVNVVEAISRLLHSSAADLIQRWPVGKRQSAGAITCASDALRVLAINLHAVRQSKYSPLLRSLAGSTWEAKDQDLISALADVLQGEYVSIRRQQSIGPLLTLLHANDVAASNLLVRIRDDPGDPSMAPRLTEQIAAVFEATMESQPVFEGVDFHGGRPAAYLLWPSRPGDHSPRSVEIQGLRALLFCISILVKHHAKGDQQ